MKTGCLNLIKLIDILKTVNTYS